MTNARCSIITVHGIRDDYRTAWIAADGCWWVKEQLCEGMSVRQVDYRYPIDASSMIYEQDGIAQHAQKLIDKYCDIRAAGQWVGASRALISSPIPPTSSETG